MRESSFEILLHEIEFLNKMVSGFDWVGLGQSVKMREERGEEGEFWWWGRGNVENMVNEDTTECLSYDEQLISFTWRNTNL